MFTTTEETKLANAVTMCAEWGYPVDKTDLRYVVKQHLDRAGKVEKRFADNLPGVEWVEMFLKRMNLSKRCSFNIGQVRAAISPDNAKSFINNLQQTLATVPPQQILNYDETNLTDDHGQKTVIAVLDSSKQSTSIIMSVSAAGDMLPPYVVYKYVHLYDYWCVAGPERTCYNRPKSGWFDSASFEDWFEKIALKHLKRSRRDKMCDWRQSCTPSISKDLRAVRTTQHSISSPSKCYTLSTAIRRLILLSHDAAMETTPP